MDTGHPEAAKQGSAAADEKAAEVVATIKAHMPQVYASIKAKGAEIGNEAFALVRRAARGERDCFYAFEGGRVVGEPFCQAVMADVAVTMVEFGSSYLVIWPAPRSGNGAH